MPTKPKKNGRRNINWEKVKVDYVTHPKLGLRDIAKKYNIRYNTVCDKSKADDWFATKKNYKAEMVSQALSKACAKDAEKLEAEIAAVNRISQKITEMLEDDRQFNKHFVEIGEGKGVYHTEVWEYEKFDVKQMKETLASLKMIEDMKRSILDIQRLDQMQRSTLERERFEFDKKMARERLELEKERIALERERNALRSQNMGAGDGAEYGVVLLPEVLSDEETEETDTTES